MAIPDLDFLLLIVEPFGSLAGAALALPENKGRRLVDTAGENSTSNPKVSSTDLWTETLLTPVRYSHCGLGK
jgi:hypothetical protein